MTASHATVQERASVMSHGGYDDDLMDLDPGGSGPRDPDKPRWPVITVVIAAFVIGALAVLGWYAYQWNLGPVVKGDVPLVLAETTPEKVRPEDPGGLEVRHQESLILNQAGGAGAEGPVERLLPPPETPLPPPRAAEPPQAATPETTPPQAAAPTVEAAEPVPAPKPAARTETTPPRATPATAPETQTAAAIPGFDLQLAALRSQDSAKQEAARLQRVLAPLLGDHSVQVHAPRPGGQSPVYRLRIGPFADRGSAQTLCTQLKAKKQDCFVVKR